MVNKAFRDRRGKVFGGVSAERILLNRVISAVEMLLKITDQEPGNPCEMIQALSGLHSRGCKVSVELGGTVYHYNTDIVTQET